MDDTTANNSTAKQCIISTTPCLKKRRWEKPTLLSLDVALTELKEGPNADGPIPYGHS